jgi:PilX N-terminal
MGKKRYRILRNDTGSALIMALLILLVLTLLGINAINTTTFETGISGNERARVEAFYAAEAGIQEALSRLSELKVPGKGSIKETQLREGLSYWGGTPEDRSDPKGIESPGFVLGPGDDPSEGVYKRYRIRITGLASGTAQQIEVQVTHNEPVSLGTSYDRN